MIPYLFMLAIIFLPKVIIKRANAKCDKIWLFYTWIILSLMMGLRGDSVGTDTHTYTSYFAQQKFGPLKWSFALLVKLFAWLQVIQLFIFLL